MQPIETEVKFHLADPPAMRTRLIGLGALSSGRFPERNIRFDNDAMGLLRSRALLRLRQARTATLTYKTPPAQADPEFKQLVEIEVEVADFAATQQILAALGFRPQQRYEKERESLRLGRTAFCMDALPFGDFLEIEGPQEEIRDYAGRLGLNWERRILMTYLEMFDIIRSFHSLKAADLTFANFNGVRVDLAACLPMMEAGRRPASG
ncbi:MAG: class IV adenylate cyclase [Desulfobacterales bacterium]|jgi:adenylate cyclase class 2|nr:class IV adenylate cyclase [Desulfobacterales bacterium]